MIAKKLLALFCLIALASSGFAISVNAPGTITLFNEPQDITVKVFNDSYYEKGLEVNFFSPFNYSVLGAPKSVNAQSYAQFVLRIYPADGFGGTYNSASLEVWLGGEKKVLPMTVVVKEKAPVSVSGTGTRTEQAQGGNSPSSGFLSLGGNFAFDSDLVLNLVLVLVAAVLLIAFIARFTSAVA